jgi:tetratricopeptide (TPR) repeat protein
MEEGRQLAQQKKIRSYLGKGRECVARNRFEDALKEVTRVFLLNASHQEARSLEQAIYTARDEYARRQAEDKRLREEQQHKMVEVQRKIEEQVRKEREEEERGALRSAKVAGCLAMANQYFLEGSLEKALSEIETAYAINPGNEKGQELEVKILSALKRKDQAKGVPQQRSIEGEAWRKVEEQKERLANEGRELLRKESMNIYRGMLKQAWVDGQPNKEENNMLGVVRRSLTISDSEHALLEREVQLETYTEALRMAWKSGIITANDAKTHENLRTLYGVSMEQHLVIEAGLLREMNQEEPSR